jgi:VWFA-related protein
MRLPFFFQGRLLRALSWALFFQLVFVGYLPVQGQDPVAPSSPANLPPLAEENSPKSTPQETSASPKTVTGAEISQKESEATFTLRVNLVQVRAVVRDAAGKAVEGLAREDFRLYDQGKLQSITNFAVETSETRQQHREAEAKTQREGTTEPGKGATAEIPERFVALVFDDIHLSDKDALSARAKMGTFIDSLGVGDRLGIFTTSAKTMQEFTADREALHNALKSVSPHPLMINTRGHDCPDVSHYLADQIVNKHDPQALQVVVEDIIQCMFEGKETHKPQAQAMAQGAVSRVLLTGDSEVNLTYRRIGEILQRVAIAPGKRVMVLVSSGFLLTTNFLAESDVVERANRSDVVINTLDPRGLYVPDVMGDISRPYTDDFRTEGYLTRYRVEQQHENEFVLMDLSLGTGGTFFHNSNDLSGGLKLLGLAPETSYVLGFSPSSQKMDGSFHALRVELVDNQKYTVQARRGYYTPHKTDDPQQAAEQEIQDAMFSEEEIRGLPLEIETRYFKSDANSANLTVVSKLQIQSIHFRKADGRNDDALLVATAIFDNNGNFVLGSEKTVTMHLLDATYEHLSHTGVSVKSNFVVKPGHYLVRQVVRDSEGAQIAARTGMVEIPN